MKLALLLPRSSSRAAQKYYSGGDLYDVQLARALERRGHHVELVRTPRRFDARRWAERLVAAGYAAILEDELGHAEYLALNRALRGRVPAIAVVHVTRARLMPGARSKATERAYLQSTSAALFVSRQVRRETARLLGVRVRSRVGYPGCDHLPPRLPRTAAASRVRFVSVGHLLPHKGQLELIEAFGEVRGPCTLRLAGDARDRSYSARVRGAAARLGAHRVSWLGPLGPAPLARVLSRADVFVSASAYESYGIAPAEAITFGLPVVSWAEGGLWEFLSPGENALRVRPGDRAGLTRALTQLCSDRALLARLQRGARRSARRLPRWDDAAAKLEELLPDERHVAS